MSKEATAHRAGRPFGTLEGGPTSEYRGRRLGTSCLIKQSTHQAHRRGLVSRETASKTATANRDKPNDALVAASVSLERTTAPQHQNALAPHQGMSTRATTANPPQTSECE